MKSAKDIDIESDFIKCFILGGYATGKSVFASSFPTPGYVFDFDQGIKTYRGKDFSYDTFPLTFRGWIEFEKAIVEVRKAVVAGEIKTVVVDSTTSMTDCAMARALQIDPKRSKEGGPLWNVHYQIVKNIMAPKLTEILSWNCNVVFVGHWNIVTDPETGEIVSIDPMLTGQLSAKVPGYFDEVYNAVTKTIGGKERFFIRTITSGHYKARSRISGEARLLPDLLPNDYNELMKCVKEATEKDKNK